MSLANYVTGVNPQIIKWARETSGFTLEEVATSFKKPAEAISAWEEGRELPTYSQLEKLANVVYKRPLAIFFLPNPPREEGIKNSFRSLTEVELEGFEPDTRYALRIAKTMQISLAELLDGKNDSKKLIFKEIRLKPGADPINISESVRQYLGISLGEQQKWTGIDNILKKWRDIVEENGVYVFKRPFKQKGISGFCLYDDEFPVIYLNNRTTKTRQIFSLFHELAHLLLNTSGITKENRNYVTKLKGDSRLIEIFCNKFAAEFLVPSKDFDKRLDLNQPTEKFVKKMALLYGVSREVILRKLLDREIVSQQEYAEFVKEWDEQRIEQKANRGSGGDYYANQAIYLGKKYLSLIFAKYHEGSISIEQLADYARVKTTSVMDVEEYL